MSIFLKATLSGWYPAFLNPVVDLILSNPQCKEILDIGTGPGTLPQLLIRKDSSLNITGVDTSSSMIKEAHRRISHKKVIFDLQEVSHPFPFEKHQFDAITICSVLFLLNDTIKNDLLKEALRVLKPKGRIIILTPSGKKAIISSLIEVWKYPFSKYNFTFPIWKLATTHSARKWQNQKYLAQFTKKLQLNYEKKLAFNNNATIEIISKHQQHEK
jgi:ubiquinone/menaquinone biosynthesis C-methylase UbiE